MIGPVRLVAKVDVYGDTYEDLVTAARRHADRLVAGSDRDYYVDLYDGRPVDDAVGDPVRWTAVARIVIPKDGGVAF